MNAVFTSVKQIYLDDHIGACGSYEPLSLSRGD